MDLIHQGEKDESSFFAGVFLTPEGQARQDQLRAKKGQDPFYGCFLTPEAQAKIDAEHERLQADEGKGIFDGLFVRARAQSDLDGYEIYPNKKED